MAAAQDSNPEHQLLCLLLSRACALDHMQLPWAETLDTVVPKADTAHGDDPPLGVYGDKAMWDVNLAMAALGGAPPVVQAAFGSDGSPAELIFAAGKGGKRWPLLSLASVTLHKKTAKLDRERACVHRGDHAGLPPRPEPLRSGHSTPASRPMPVHQVLHELRSDQLHVRRVVVVVVMARCCWWWWCRRAAFRSLIMMLWLQPRCPCPRDPRSAACQAAGGKAGGSGQPSGRGITDRSGGGGGDHDRELGREH